MNLQEDEIEFSNPVFKELVNQILNIYLKEGNFEQNDFLNQLEPELEQIVIDILMNENKYELHGWLDKKQVFVKEKDDDAVLKRLISETIISYREYLIQNLSKELVASVSQENATISLQEAMQTINDYNRLKSNVSNSIGRIRTDYFK